MYKRQAVEAAVARVAAELGAPTILVNNAGITRDNLLHKMSEADWDLVMSVHLRGSFLMTRACQTHMVAAKFGRIINLSSTSAQGNRGQTNYSTAKAGLQGMAKTLAVELGRFGITANAVAPGFIQTEMVRQTAERMGMPFEDRVVGRVGEEGRVDGGVVGQRTPGAEPHALVGGLLGTLAIGFLADPDSPAGVAGLLYGGGLDQLGRQAVGAFAVLAYSFVVTFALGKALDLLLGFRVTRVVENAGIDLAEHSEVGYDLSPVYYSALDRVGRTLLVEPATLPPHALEHIESVRDSGEGTHREEVSA